MYLFLNLWHFCKLPGEQILEFNKSFLRKLYFLVKINLIPGRMGPSMVLRQMNFSTRCVVPHHTFYSALRIPTLLNTCRDRIARIRHTEHLRPSSHNQNVLQFLEIVEADNYNVRLCIVWNGTFSLNFYINKRKKQFHAVLLRLLTLRFSGFYPIVRSNTG